MVPHGLTPRGWKVKPESRAGVSGGGGEEANTKEMQGERCALCWPNYKDLHCSRISQQIQRQAFVKELKKEKSRGKQKSVKWLLSWGTGGKLGARDIPFSVFGVSKSMT